MAFGFATAAPPAFRLWPERPEKTVMGAPKASYAPFYLSGAEKDWSSATAQLAGRKRYLARHDGAKAESAIQAALKSQLTGGPDDRTASFLQFINSCINSNIPNFDHLFPKLNQHF